MMIYHVYTYNCVEYNLEQITSRNRCLPFLTDATPKPSNGLFHRFSDGHCPIMVLIVVLNPLLFFDRHPTTTTVGCQQSAFLGRSMLQWRGRRGTGVATPKSMASSSNLHRITKSMSSEEGSLFLSLKIQQSNIQIRKIGKNFFAQKLYTHIVFAFCRFTMSTPFPFNR